MVNAVNVYSLKCKLSLNNLGSSLCPVPMITGHIAMQTRVQDWTRVRLLTGPVARTEVGSNNLWVQLTDAFRAFVNKLF